MAKLETRAPANLNLSWPHFVNYHVDIARPAASNFDGDHGAEPSDAGRQKLVTTYNGVPRKDIRNAQPLVENEIRVLVLNGGKRGTLLVGSLRKVRLSDPFSNKDVYEPLSYTWEDFDTVEPSGDSTEDDVIPMLFLSDSGCFLKLTSNCAMALSSIRKPTTERTIWVDSICVNQDDPDERSRQVDLMKDIYARAFTVLVYLGRESKEGNISSNIAMSWLRHPDQLQDFLHLRQHKRASVKRLFERRYFRRMWIVQEVTLAQTLELHCGPRATYISEFAGNPLNTILGSRVAPPWLRHSKQAINEMSNAQARPQPEQILSLVFDTAFCGCKDDRDRIFALFSLLNPGNKEILRADYNLSTEQVYAGVAAYLATNGLLWGVLMLAPRLALNSYPGLPSWVPDWSSLGRVGLQAPPHLFELMVSRSQALGPDTRVGVTSSGVMTIRGMLLGPVSYSKYSWSLSPGNKSRRDPDMDLDLDQRLAADLFRKKGKHDGFSGRHGNGSTWTLTRPNQDKSLDSWEWHFEFMTRPQQPDDASYVAFILPDYSTVLILRPDESFRDLYTLVEIGMP